MEFTFEKFNEIKREAEDFYHKINSVHSPYFNEKIHFNIKGWDHLIFKSWNRTRSIADQFSRLRHVKLTPKIIEQSRTLQGLWKTQKFERVKKKSSGWETVLKVVTYYEFIAVMESHGSKVRVKVIVKQVDGGEKFFLSIIPFWGIDKKGERVMYSGDPEND
ncbi:hypothetical protein COU49_00425 [Candidatus Nomurabacteria bacterium CG10_big_fil_rev_8_21_14_0_10_35_16]|uniref:Uncharacterized protein n=1 Tax=Candidatus Nomurabacteria bacterium CG10_big_fil_rev_8_21_14_0_10_35_16 TaxID=1974731 RepID=A0A2H0TDL3_9BACT|nr:MAG: hypothetical protein COU49_00425 [Candidatus Nomurabacteria bacterium CG10_big_fil_rev_8_21_14_0_10_35_16]